MLADRMSTQPRISVVVPFLNSESYIAACIESLLAQQDVAGTYEIILVNNGSTDASERIVRRYSGLTVLGEDSPGAYAARNTGIQEANAPLIAFTDADCAVATDWLQSIERGMRDPGIGILIGHCQFPARASLALRLLGAYENAKTEYVINRCAPAQHFAYANNMAVRTSVFDELGPFRDWKRAADTELVHRLASRRPDLRIAYDRSMRITHLEFLSARARLKRLKLYTRTNSKISDFRELDLAKRVAVLVHLLGGGRAR